MQFAIPSYLPFPVSPFDISCVILTIKSENCTATELAKKMNIILKGFIKQPVIKQSLFFLFFFSHWVLNECFSFVTKAFVNYEKLIRFNQQAFIVYNRVNLKTLIEIFCQELVVFNVVLAFLDHLKLKIFFKHGDRYIAPLFRLLFKISGSAPAHNLLPLSFQHKVFY